MRGGSSEVAELIVEAGADINQRGSLGVSPLMEAAQWNSVGVAEFLLECHASVVAKDTSLVGFTPLHHCAETNSADVAELLLEARADVGVLDRCERSAMDIATQAGAEETLNQLRKHGGSSVEKSAANLKQF